MGRVGVRWSRLCPSRSGIRINERGRWTEERVSGSLRRGEPMVEVVEESAELRL
jgi:hypothetical protein